MSTEKKTLLELMEELAPFEKGVVAWNDPWGEASEVSRRCASHLLGALPGEDPRKAVLRRTRLARRLDALAAADRKQKLPQSDQGCG